MDKDRAAYMRAYRAARRAQPVEHVCEGCGTAFAHQRADARFCSSACRSAKWRPITHHALHHGPDGFAYEPNQYGYPGLRTCVHGVLAGLPCGATATWQHDFVVNRENALVWSEYLCDDHLGDAPDGTRVGVPIAEVMDADGREARARHGRPAPAVTAKRSRRR
jgi:hypothetical protein